MNADHPAGMKPRARTMFVVSWVVKDGHATVRRFYLVRYYAARFRDKLLAAGRDVEMFETDVDWHEATS